MAKKLLWLLLVAGCAPAPRAADPDPAPPPEKHAPPAADVPSHRTRVLYVEGYPRWNYRSLHNALIREPSVDVHCFLISADADFPQEHSLKTDDPVFAAPLETLPMTMKELLVYDVVVIGDVGPEEWPGGADLLETFVSEHGRGVVAIAGEGHMPAGWRGTRFEKVLPVQVDAEPSGLTEESECHVTEDGKKSPLLVSTPTDVRIQWAVVTRCKPAGLTLAEAGPDGKRIPLFVTARYGEGRVFFAATDETWRWRFGTGDQPHFLPFWRGVIEWVRRPE